MSLQSTIFRLGISCTLLASIAFAQTTGATFGSVINLGGTPSDLVIDELRGRMYSVNSTANRIDVISLGERKVMKSIVVGNFPLAAALAPDSAFLYVTNTQSASLSVIDLGSDSVINTVSLPAKPEGVAAGADGITVHVEVGDTDALLGRIRDAGCKVGLTLEPATPYEAVAPYLDRLDTLLVMSVRTGFGGQSFIPDVLDKVRIARREIAERGLATEIEIDGGINIETAPLAAAAGVDILVAGTAVFGQSDPQAAAAAIRSAASA